MHYFFTHPDTVTIWLTTRELTTVSCSVSCVLELTQCHAVQNKTRLDVQRLQRLTAGFADFTVSGLTTSAPAEVRLLHSLMCFVNFTSMLIFCMAWHVLVTACMAYLARRHHSPASDPVPKSLTCVSSRHPSRPSLTLVQLSIFLAERQDKFHIVS